MIPTQEQYLGGYDIVAVLTGNLSIYWKNSMLKLPQQENKPVVSHTWWFFMADLLREVYRLEEFRQDICYAGRVWKVAFTL
jgi:hypothetical protein